MVIIGIGESGLWRTTGGDGDDDDGDGDDDAADVVEVALFFFLHRAGGMCDAMRLQRLL